MVQSTSVFSPLEMLAICLADRGVTPTQIPVLMQTDTDSWERRIDRSTILTRTQTEELTVPEFAAYLSV